MHQRHEDPDMDRRVRSSLRWSVLDGASFAIMIGMAESYFQAFAVFLKAGVFLVGVIYTVPMFLASVVQLFSAAVVRWVRSRRRFTVIAGALRSLLFVPLLLVPFLGPYRVWVLLVIISAYFSLNYLPVPAWTSWMRDLVDENSRGAYFSRRNRIANLLALLGIVLAGLVLQLFQDTAVVGFTVIFAAAALGSIGSTVFLSLKVDPPYEETRGVRREFLRLSGELLHSNFGRFVLYTVLLHFGVFFAGPFFVPYVLEDLGQSYLQFMVHTSLVVLVKFAALPLWGEASDRYGTKRVLTLATLLIAVLPFLWMLGRSFWWICLIQGLGGLAWAGFDIAALNFPYDVLPAGRVARNTSFVVFYKGLAILLGGLAGGYFLRHVHLFDSRYFGNFFVSGLIRLALAVPVVLLLREERAVEHISYRDLLLRLVSIGPRRGLQLLAIGRARGGSGNGRGNEDE